MSQPDNNIPRSGTPRSGKPRIGITTSKSKKSLAWLCDYWSVRWAGGRPVRLRPGRPIPELSTLDGLIIGGGDDISASLYQGEVNMDVKVDTERDELEQSLLRLAVPQKMPILGICRGSQMINVHLGGTLHSDIYKVYDNKQKIRTIWPRMPVNIMPESRLSELLERQKCKVNSLHHQSVRELGRNLQVAAYDECGVVQAIEHVAHPFLIGVQWHPEFLMLSKAQRGIFRELVRQAGKWRA